MGSNQNTEKKKEKRSQPPKHFIMVLTTHGGVKQGSSVYSRSQKRQRGNISSRLGRLQAAVRQGGAACTGSYGEYDKLINFFLLQDIPNQ